MAHLRFKGRPLCECVGRGDDIATTNNVVKRGSMFSEIVCGYGSLGQAEAALAFLVRLNADYPADSFSATEEPCPHGPHGMDDGERQLPLFPREVNGNGDPTGQFQSGSFKSIKEILDEADAADRVEMIDPTDQFQSALFRSIMEIGDDDGITCNNLGILAKATDHYRQMVLSNTDDAGMDELAKYAILKGLAALDVAATEFKSAVCLQARAVADLSAGR